MRKSNQIACLILGLALLALAAPQADSQDLPTSPPQPAAPKTKKIGFAQFGAASSWRVANTQSLKDEAQKRMYELILSDAQRNPAHQIAALRSFIAQKVDVIVLAPVIETGWDEVLGEAKTAHIPVILLDRPISAPDDLYTVLVSSDFVDQGRRAVLALADKSQGRAAIFVLEGTINSAPQADRKAGFDEILKNRLELKIIQSQTADFMRPKAREVMAAFLKTPAAAACNAVFAENDDMALGAIAAIKDAGKKPGADILVVSIDGTKAAYQAIIDGQLNATVECNPRTGPQVFDAIDLLLKKHITTQETVIDASNAKELLPTHSY